MAYGYVGVLVRFPLQPGADETVMPEGLLQALGMAEETWSGLDATPADYYYSWLVVANDNNKELWVIDRGYHLVIDDLSLIVDKRLDASNSSFYGEGDKA